MPEEVKLKPCPFCGGKAEIREFESGYYISCVVCHSFGVGIDAVCSKEKVVSSWNRRSPEPGMSIIRWTRYDGTPETLPEDGDRVLLVRVNQRKFRADTFDFEIHDGVNKWNDFIDRFDVQVGDCWVLLPDPPEVMK